MSSTGIVGHGSAKTRETGRMGLVTGSALPSCGRGRGIVEKTQWCDNGRAHTGPFFTITGVAMEVGPGTRQRTRKRIQARKTLGRLCAKCLRVAVFRLKGADFYTLESRDPLRD